MHAEVLKEIEKRAGQNNWPIIGREKGRLLGEVVKKYQPKRVLEVGTLVGYSAILMSKHLPKGARIVTLEINPEIARIARENFGKAGISEMVALKVGDAIEIIPKLSGPFDLVFLDAAKEQYLRYLKLAEPKMPPQVVIVADNVKIFANQMTDYLDYVRAGGGYESQTYDFGSDAVEVSVRR